MSWEEKCIPALLNQGVFLSPQHFSRFETAFAYLRHQPFFTKGVCKCAVLAAWDQPNYDFFMSTMHEMADRKDITPDYMLKKGELLVHDPDPNRGLLFQLSVDFLKYPGQTPSENVILKLSGAWVPLVDSAITASLILDQL